tara:strand:- start:329 stop:817 length:489 start_codon:yes stop_codon:yes gene_type:complete
MDFKLDDETRLNFDNMLKESGASDNTTKIRKLKHSDKIREEISIMMDIKKKYSRLGKRGLDKMLESKCNWLFSHYTNIFNKLKKNELSLSILDKFLSTLKDIENGISDQHEASVKIGQILKELYIDSAVKNQKKIDERANKNKKKHKKPVKNITWCEYKKTM